MTWFRVLNSDPLLCLTLQTPASHNHEIGV